MAQAVSLFPEPETPALRPVIAWSAVVLILLTVLPWFTGGQDPTALLISGFSLVLLALLLWRQPSVRQVRGGVTTWLALALLGWGALSLIWSVNRYDTALWLIYLAMPILGFVLTAQVAESLAIRRRLVLGYVGVSLVFVIYGVWLYLTGSYPRFTSVIYWPNPAAAYLLPALLVTIDRAVATGKRGWAYRVPAIILATGFWLADSRGATIALATALILYFAFTKEKIRYCINLVFIVIIGFALSIACLQIREHVFHQSSAVTPWISLCTGIH